MNSIVELLSKCNVFVEDLQIDNAPQALRDIIEVIAFHAILTLTTVLVSLINKHLKQL